MVDVSLVMLVSRGVFSLKLSFDWQGMPQKRGVLKMVAQTLKILIKKKTYLFVAKKVEGFMIITSNVNIHYISYKIQYKMQFS